jgi:uncharacterized membrane protein
VPSPRRAKKSNPAVSDFDGIHTVDEVLNKLSSLQKAYLIDLEDTCAVEHAGQMERSLLNKPST